MYNSNLPVDRKNRDARLTRQMAKLGTPQNPAELRVPDEARKAEVTAICQEHGWSCEVTVDADQPENIAELEALQKPVTTVHVTPTVGRNDPCHCGSGLKYKHCHGRK
ncbi:MAG: SEC-C metal-binding domain-containing protein [Caldilineaceae bacterium]